MGRPVEIRAFNISEEEERNTSPRTAAALRAHAADLRGGRQGHLCCVLDFWERVPTVKQRKHLQNMYYKDMANRLRFSDFNDINYLTLLKVAFINRRNLLANIYEETNRYILALRSQLTLPSAQTTSSFSFLGTPNCARDADNLNEMDRVK